MPAAELQRLEVDHLLIEKLPRRAYFCKALGVTPRTLEIFDGLGVGAQAIDAGDTERILEACLYRHGGSVHRGMTLAGFTDASDAVEAQVLDAAGTVHPVRCRWLVGCDGARSAVRQGLGLDFSGGQYPMSFMLGDVELDWNLARGRVYRFRQIVEGQLRNAMVAVPVRGSTGRYRISLGAPLWMSETQEGLWAGIRGATHA